MTNPTTMPANLTATPGWDTVPQWETSTPLLGGAGKEMNVQAQALLNRTEQLKASQGAPCVGRFGAKGDGTTDDSAALIAANADATGHANGGEVRFAAGQTYRVSANVTFDSDVTLWFEDGAKLSIDAGITVTAPGTVISLGGTPNTGAGTFNALYGLLSMSPGGSLGVGTTTPNVHAGDDGTTTRVVGVLAKTAPLFIGMTTRDNTEAGGPVGRSIASFEGYRLSNAQGSQECGALRVISEGVSATQLGARVSILTRRDGFTESDFLERFAVQNDGNILHSGGSGAVGSANRANYASAHTVFTISGKVSGRGVLELSSGSTDADQTIIGEILTIGNYQTDEKRIAILQTVLAGGTATKRGGELRMYLKADNGALTERVRFSATKTEFFNDVRLSGVSATGSAAPTLAITSNAIAPTTSISFVGAGLIKNITVPSAFQVSGGVGGGSITIIPTAAFTTDTTGNIALASTAVVNRAIRFTYDNGTGKWYPSY